MLCVLLDNFMCYVVHVILCCFFLLPFRFNSIHTNSHFMSFFTQYQIILLLPVFLVHYWLMIRVNKKYYESLCLWYLRFPSLSLSLPLHLPVPILLSIILLFRIAYTIERKYSIWLTVLDKRLTLVFSS